MPDIAAPNLPSRDFAAPLRFFARLGFECGHRDEGWMILYRGPAGSRAVDPDGSLIRLIQND